MLLTRYAVDDTVPWNELENAETLHDLRDMARTRTTSLACPAPRCYDWIPVKKPFDVKRVSTCVGGVGQ